MGAKRQNNFCLLGRGDILKRFFEKLFTTEPGNGSKSTKLRYFIIIALVGVLLLLLSNIFSDKRQQIPEVTQEPTVLQSEREEESSIASEIEQLARGYEKNLENMLNKIEGVSEAEVMVNLASSDVKVHERNIISGVQTTSEEDSNGGTRRVEDKTEDSQVVLVRQGDRESPLLVQTLRPEVTGVFVVAKGAEQATVKSWIIEAISSVLDVPSHRIAVMPKD